MDLTHTATAAQHAAESLTELHEGKLSNTGTGMSQVDQAYRAVERFQTALDIVLHEAIMAERAKDEAVS